MCKKFEFRPARCRIPFLIRALRLVFKRNIATFGIVDAIDSFIQICIKNVDFLAPQFSNWGVFTQALSSLSISFDLVVMFVFVDEKVYYMSVGK